MNNTKQKILIARIGGYLCAMVLIVWGLSGPIPTLVDSANNLGVAAGAVLFIICLVALTLISLDIWVAVRKMVKRREEK